MNNNRRWNAKNPYQGDRTRVLCVCSAGLLRSPTMANVLASEPFNFNTRAVGINQDFALIPIDDVLLHWAHEVWVVEPWMVDTVIGLGWEQSVECLDINDNYNFMDPKLVELIIDRATNIINKRKG